jgi:DNA polymerase sigma
MIIEIIILFDEELNLMTDISSRNSTKNLNCCRIRTFTCWE